ncbi:melanoma inhibitory activity protein 2 isoform X2 [Trichosurus vulpecula]|uniref:melanoma inhibitory activity protein 2 isoform X2 n=1 Tax=Trichosurus vulpecula TaxID=9337 RepID=UPI00186AC20D|nr:melanoma inhibitory activity protein 2 isoform X2 [Trichosurus vulpecula]
MGQFGVHRIFLLIISLIKSSESTTLLAEFKNCGDVECETLLSRAVAIRDYEGPDCQYLNFKTGEEISVYAKLSGEREDLWAGSKGKDFGYFPKDAIQVEEVFISEEVKVPTKESDFICLHELNYVFEKEELYNDDEVTDYSDVEEENQESNTDGSEFQRTPEIYLNPENTELDNQSPTTDSAENIRSTDESGVWGKEEPESLMESATSQESPSHVAQVDLPSSSWVTGWFGLGSRKVKGETFESAAEPQQESSFLSREIAVSDENDLKELNIDQPLEKHELDPTSEFDPGPLEEPAPEPELEEVPDAQTTSWLDDDFIAYFGFGQRDLGFKLSSEENTSLLENASLLEDIPITVPSNQEPIVPHTEKPSEVEEHKTNDHPALQPSWFDLLYFAYPKKEQKKTDKQEREDSSGGNDNENLSSSDFDLDNNEERETDETGEIKHQTDKERVLQEPGDSDTSPYLETLLDNADKPLNSHNIPKETKSPFFKKFWGQDKPFAIDKTEELSSESQIREDVEVRSKTKNSQSDSKMKHKEESQWQQGENSPSSTPERNGAKEDAYEFQILEYLLQIKMHDLLISAEKVVAALPEDMRPGTDLYGFPWEMVLCAVTVGFFTLLLFLCRGFYSVKSRLYVGREKQLAKKISELVEEKCKILKNLSLCQKEYENLESSLKDGDFERESLETPNLELFEGSQILEAVYEKLNRANSLLTDEIQSLETDLKEEKSKRSEQDELMADIKKRIQSLEDESKSIKSQVAEAKTTLKVFQLNEERLKTSIEDALQENSHLQESQKQLLQEAEGWKERLNELNEQKKMFETSKANMEQVITNKESQIKSLTECLLKMEDWATALGEDNVSDNHCEAELNSDSAVGDHLDDHQKQTVKKLIYAAKLNACLKTLEAERNQIYSQLSDEDKIKEELKGQIEVLHTEQVSLQTENAYFESEVQKLQQKLKVMTELYQENEMKLHRKLTVEEKDRLQKEEKLSKAGEKISHASEELNSYRERAKDLEEELERTIRSYESQITAHEKKAHDNWLSARAAERHLNDLKKENAHNRQKLTETEFKYDLLEKDPYALDVPNRSFGREHSPYGPSPMGRPSPEMRAFLSPPTLLEGPLRLSPLLPGGGGRGSRGPGHPLEYQNANERGELSDPHRAPSDTGSLSPPWDRDRRMMIPHSDEVASSEMESSRNDTKDDFGNLNMPDPSLAPQSEAAGPGFVPPPLVRGPLLPVDPRGSKMRRGPPITPPPPGSMYGPPRGYFPPSNFPGPPHPQLSTRSVYPPRAFPHYLPSRDGFFPPPPHPESRNEQSSGLIQPSNEPAADHREPQQET